MHRWAAVRRALVVALVATLTLLWQAASWSGDRTVSVVYIVSALAYVAGAVAAAVLYARWSRRHRAVVIVAALASQRLGGGLRRRWVRPRLWGYGSGEGGATYYVFQMPVGMTLT